MERQLVIAGLPSPRVYSGTMKTSFFHGTVLAVLVATGLGILLLRGEEPARTGPATEKRFPPLQVPAGFKATLFACDPLIEYPSVIAAGPRPGALFVAVDYMTGLGTEIIRRDEIRLVEDTDGDGYADKATVFAQGFNSIQGLAYHAGTVYVMHAPFLTALRANKGTGVADERRDLVAGLGLAPEQNPPRLHCANGVEVGHDGWLYLALGDHGADVRRPEGDRLVLQGGGILRCRPDGRDLHIFATGLRNIYDVALDGELNVFVRDNENDGGTYMIRVCHSFHDADHGYPYLYEDKPDEALRPLADLGRGSSAGGVCYREPHLPAEYHGNLFFCEWGRSLVRYEPRPAGSGFAPLKERTFAEGAAGDPYGFKPTDIVVQRDGTLMVSDWADGQRPKRGRGRIYHLAYGAAPKAHAEQRGTGPKQWLRQLDSESYCERWDAQEAIERLGPDGRKLLLASRELGTRGRLHAVWALAHLDSATAIDDLLRLARSDVEPVVRAQVVRAIADLADPVLAQHRLDAGPGDADLATRLAELGKRQDDRVRREVIIALGRLRWQGTPDWLAQYLGEPDAALAHAAQQALRRVQNWPALLKLLDTPLRAIALRAAAERYEPQMIDGLIQRLGTEAAPARRREYAETLTRVYKKPGPWIYWGYRPPPRPANTVTWECTEAIGHALDRALADPDRAVRVAALRQMQREQVPIRLARLATWLADERQPDAVAALLTALAAQPAIEARRPAEAVVRDRRHSDANRRTALTLVVRGLDTADPALLLTLAQALENGPLLAEALRCTAKYPEPKVAPVLAQHLRSADAEVRAAALETLAELRADAGRAAVLQFLRDADVRVRRAGAGAAGRLGVREAIEPLLTLVTAADAPLRRASLDALCRLREPRAVPLAVAALTDRAVVTQALECVGELGGPDQAAAIADFARHTPSAEVQAAVVRILTAWRDRQAITSAQRQKLDAAVAQVQGANGILVRWQADEGKPGVHPTANQSLGGKTVLATGTEGRVVLTPKSDPAFAWLASTEVCVDQVAPVEFLASSSGTLQVWLNGKSIYHRDQARKFQVDSDRFAATLAKGANRLLVRVDHAALPVEFHLRFRRKSASAERERLAQAALNRAGDPERGRKLFFDAEKSLCVKCHRLGDTGERIGPELTNIGGRFARIYLVESILEPSRTIAPSYGTLVVTLKDGRIVTGVKVAESATILTLGDNQGVQHALRKADIDELQPSLVSTMPENLEQRFSEAEFVDLIAFLAGQKEGRRP